MSTIISPNYLSPGTGEMLMDVVKYLLTAGFIGSLISEKFSYQSLLQKSLFVIPEVFIGNPVFFKIKDFWIPAFAGMTAKAVSSIHLQEAHQVAAFSVTGAIIIYVIAFFTIPPENEE